MSSAMVGEEYLVSQSDDGEPFVWAMRLFNINNNLNGKI
jgi:hypothetical protein